MRELFPNTGIHLLGGSWRSAQTFLVAEPEPTLIDAARPGQAAKVLRELASIGIRPRDLKRIILTHHHWDHAGSAAELKRLTGAEVAAHAGDVAYIDGTRPRRPMPRGFPNSLVWTLFRMMGAANVETVPVDRLLADDEDISGLRVIHTPGHTPGHICLMRDNILFSGDLVRASLPDFGETPHMFTRDLAESRRSIKKVAALDFAVVLSSHMPPVMNGGAEKMRELARRLDVRAMERAK